MILFLKLLVSNVVGGCREARHRAIRSKSSPDVSGCGLSTSIPAAVLPGLSFDLPNRAVSLIDSSILKDFPS
jgi:hypothetical protein